MGLYLYHGLNEVLSRDALRQLMTAYPESEISLFTSKNFNFTDFKNTCETRSMFSTRRIVVVEGTLTAADLERVVDSLSGLARFSDIVFWQDTRLKKNNPLMKAVIKSNGEVKEFKQFLPTNIFPLLDAVIFKNRRRAFLELYRLLGEGIQAVYILKMLAWQFRNLLFVRLDAQSKKSMHPVVLSKTTRAAKMFRKEDLITIYSNLLDIDVQLKTGTVDQRLLLERLLWKII